MYVCNCPNTNISPNLKIEKTYMCYNLQKIIFPYFTAKINYYLPQVSSSPVVKEDRH